MIKHNFVNLVLYSIFIVSFIEAREKIWRTFSATDIGDNKDKIVEYRIVTLPENKFEEALELIEKYYMKDEPLFKAFNLINDPIAIAFYKHQIESDLKQGLSLACFKAGSDKIIALDILAIQKKDKPTDKSLSTFLDDASESFFRLNEVIAHLADTFDVYKHYNVPTYLKSGELLVLPEYRGRGIAKQLLLCRKEICAEHNINVTSTYFSSDISNTIAEAVGFELNVRLIYAELSETYNELNYINSKELTIRSIDYRNPRIVNA